MIRHIIATSPKNNRGCRAAKPCRGVGQRPTILLVLAACLLLFSLTGCGNNAQTPQEHKRTFLAMDTVVSLTAIGGDNAAQALDEAEARLTELDAMADMHKESSDISRLNAAAGKNAVILHPEIYSMLTAAVSCSRVTDGAWDITVAPLTKMWRDCATEGRLPTSAEINAARALVGWEKIVLDDATESAYLPEKGMAVDLGGIAKGYALDEVRRIYAAHGVNDGLINMGSSSICAVGTHSGKPWRIGIRCPGGDDDEAEKILSLTDTALATSGDYERGWEINGKWYHHIIDPHTGYPADSGLRSVTVLINTDQAGAGMTADALSTAVLIMGQESAEPILAAQTARAVYE